MIDLFAGLDAAGMEDRNFVDQLQALTNQLEGTEAGIATPVSTPLENAFPFELFEPEPMYSVSSTFQGEFTLDGKKTDAILITFDRIIFHVHTLYLDSVSKNGFNSLLNLGTRGSTVGVPVIITVPEDSSLFNIVIHTIYNMSCSEYYPPLDVLLDAVQALKTYGMPLHQFVVPDTPLYNHILLQAPRKPLDVFIIAAENDLEDLAVAASAHLLSLQLPDITDEMAARMGSFYLRRLFQLHMERVNDLKRALLEPPKTHVDTVSCGFVEQKKLARAWALAAAGLLWEVKPGMNTSLVEFLDK
ncbi:hypothetical protein EUX98_g2123 [Antrodiella citrinella]|uniref:BTB domain-containing protein n=1 Tax=Antrodiella citrinella TaxID=2447956 RepID=A0A4S4MZV6_9APHY|nr:hypothetical protein EUX98_g2123 [Antrodiella citrinella]